VRGAILGGLKVVMNVNSLEVFGNIGSNPLLGGLYGCSLLYWRNGIYDKSGSRFLEVLSFSATLRVARRWGNSWVLT